LAGAETGAKDVTANSAGGDKAPIRQGDAVPANSAEQNPDNARNDKQDEKDAEKAPAGSMNPHNGDQSPVRQGNAVKGMKEDMDALFNGEELSEEFKTKAATIYEAAVMARVNQEVTRIEEEFAAKLAEQVEQNTQGIVEQVDGYLGYIAEQWIAQNEIALEAGMKSEILESFVEGLKTVFEQHYIEVPEEKFDVLGNMQEQLEALEAKLNEQVAANVEMVKAISEAQRTEIINTVSEGLTDIESEKFNALVEELSYEDAATFETKVKTIRENYFPSGVKKADAESLNEQVDDAEDKKVEINDPFVASVAQAISKTKL